MSIKEYKKLLLTVRREGEVMFVMKIIEFILLWILIYLIIH